jgi:hypothetical protein
LQRWLGECSPAPDIVEVARCAIERQLTGASFRRAPAYKAVGDVRRAKRHTRLGAAVRKRLAESLPDGDPLRLKFERRSGSLSVA